MDRAFAATILANPDNYQTELFADFSALNPPIYTFQMTITSGEIDVLTRPKVRGFLVVGKGYEHTNYDVTHAASNRPYSLITIGS